MNTSDLKFNTNAQIMVTVPRTLHLLLLNPESNFVKKIRGVVLDEIHQIQR